MWSALAEASFESPTELLDYVTLPDRRRLRIVPPGHARKGRFAILFAFEPGQPVPPILLAHAGASRVRDAVCSPASISPRRTLALVSASMTDGRRLQPIGLAENPPRPTAARSWPLVVRDERQHHHVGTGTGARTTRRAGGSWIPSLHRPRRLVGELVAIADTCCRASASSSLSSKRHATCSSSNSFRCLNHKVLATVPDHPGEDHSQQEHDPRTSIHI